MFEAEKPHRERRFLLFGGLVLLIASISASLAATITINTNNSIEFGQRIVRLEACDEWVRVVPRSGAGEENNYVKYIDIEGLDSAKCKNVNIDFSFFSSGSETPLSVLTLPKTPVSCVEATGGSSVSPSGQGAPTGCDSNNSTVYLRQLNNQPAAVVNMTFANEQSVRAVDFIGGGDDNSYPGRRVWKTELFRCSNSSFTSCLGIGEKTKSWSGYSGSTNNVRYPERSFWIYDQHAKSVYFQLKLIPWSVNLSSYDGACGTHCPQVGEILPLTAQDKMTFYINSNGAVHLNKFGVTDPQSTDLIGVNDNNDWLDLTYTSSNGKYTVEVDFPVAEVSDINSIIVQTR